MVNPKTFEKTEEFLQEEAVLYIDNREGEYQAYLEYIKKLEEEKSEKTSGEIVFQM